MGGWGDGEMGGWGVGGEGEREGRGGPSIHPSRTYLGEIEHEVVKERLTRGEALAEEAWVSASDILRHRHTA